jgi:hypothetical protein
VEQLETLTAGYAMTDQSQEPRRDHFDVYPAGDRDGKIVQDRRSRRQIYVDNTEIESEYRKGADDAAVVDPADRDKIREDIAVRLAWQKAREQGDA